MSSFAVPPFLWSEAGVFASPKLYEVPGSGEVQPYTATATYTNASGQAITPALRIKSGSGNLLALVFPPETIADGAGAEVTFVPPFGAAASSPASGGGIQFDTLNAGDWLSTQTTNASGAPVVNGTAHGTTLLDTSNGGVIVAATAVNNEGVTLYANGSGNSGVDLEAHGTNNAGLDVTIDGSGNGGVGIGVSGTGNGGFSVVVSNGQDIGFLLNGGGNFRIRGLPTSAVGLVAGDLWNNGGVVNIV